jgi:hypothetical protein
MMDFLSLGSNLLESKADGIEVSYNACGVLSHIMFDGPEAWGVCEPQRAEVEDRMWAAIQSWDINSRRNINYRSEMGRYTAWRIRSCLSQHGVPELSTLVLFSKGVCPHSL